MIDIERPNLSAYCVLGGEICKCYRICEALHLSTSNYHLTAHYL